MVSVALPWLEVTHDLSKKFSKLTLTVTRKQEEVETLSTSVAQFDEDYNELKAWLHDKEMEYSQLSQQAKDACSDDSLNLINKCKVCNGYFNLIQLYQALFGKLVLCGKGLICDCTNMPLGKQRKTGLNRKIL